MFKDKRADEEVTPWYSQEVRTVLVYKRSKVSNSVIDECETKKDKNRDKETR